MQWSGHGEAMVHELVFAESPSGYYFVLEKIINIAHNKSSQISQVDLCADGNLFREYNNILLIYGGWQVCQTPQSRV